MKLYVDAASPFARKVRVVVRELSLRIDEVSVVPRESDELKRVNPLGKIPALALDDGSVLFDSRVICEFLNHSGSGTFFPGTSLFRSNTGRWRALVLHALADGLCDALVAMTMENRLAAERRNEDALTSHRAAVTRSLAALERLVPKFSEAPTIGEIATGCALGYLDFRHDFIAWHEQHSALAAWYEKFSQYPSMKATEPK